MPGKSWGILAGVGNRSCQLSFQLVPVLLVSSVFLFPCNYHTKHGLRHTPAAEADLTLPSPPVRPFFKKSETFHPPLPELRDQHRLAYEPSVFGDSGPIQVAYSREFSSSHSLWHKTLNALGLETNKAHLAGSNVGVWTNVCSVDPGTTTRSYSTSYCPPGSPAANLHILTEASAQEIILAQNNGEWSATGVRFTHQGREFVVSVSREVILSTGSVQSPQILELSGVGKPDVLAAAGIPVKVSSPMVGENLQDHLSTYE